VAIRVLDARFATLARDGERTALGDERGVDARALQARLRGEAIGRGRALRLAAEPPAAHEARVAFDERAIAVARAVRLVGEEAHTLLGRARAAADLLCVAVAIGEALLVAALEDAREGIDAIG